MPLHPLVTPDDIRSAFSAAMSKMYRTEVPQYGTLIDVVAQVNEETLAADPHLREQLSRAGELERLSDERHGAIRLGTAEELATIARLFAVMGMYPVGYYDLSVAGIPVHSTAFRPVDQTALAKNPFRVFTSVLRLDLIENRALREEAQSILADRSIFTPGALELTALSEEKGGLTAPEAARFVEEALETFRWHSEATVDAATYRRLRAVHPLVADVVCFKGPHINHLTPRTLDIEAVQRRMPERGIDPKAVIEGPPERRCPLLLRQTSFKALQEPISFRGETGLEAGHHTARFGEIEQRGAALTPDGRALYDTLLTDARVAAQTDEGGGAKPYEIALSEAFENFADAWNEIRLEGLGYFRYAPTDEGLAVAGTGSASSDLQTLIANGHVAVDPIVYEDFLPVSAAGIFQSNLGSETRSNTVGSGNRDAFERALGRSVLDEFALYEKIQARSIDATMSALRPARTAVA